MTLIFSNFGKASMSDGLTIAILFRTLMLLASLPGALSLPGYPLQQPNGPNRWLIPIR